ncbi:MAG: carboxypeptidase M32 [Candidatus Algichlamydia australiensis]|nr:carboxypeptidase M32 [Chlamydiales bacterium]
MFIVSFFALAISPAVEQQDYNEIVEHFEEVHILESLSGLAYWDQEVYMPKKGLDLRTKQLAYLSGAIHEKQTDPLLGEKLAKLIDLDTGEILSTSLSSSQMIALQEWRKDYLKREKLDPDFVKELTALVSQSIPRWIEAKENHDFAAFAPQLEQFVEISREKAELLGYEKHPYDALLNEYEPGMTTEKLDALFASIKRPLIELVKKSRTQAPSQETFLGNFNPAKQIAFCNEILETMGLDLDRARLDRTHHPFTLGMHPNDIRLTTTDRPNDMKSVLSSTIHEGGHSLYYQGLPGELFHTPLGQDVSTGIHESQSRIWETCIGLSKPFWQYFFPKLQASFPESFQDLTFEEFYARMVEVSSSLIRIEADELTYTLHIILRYELEKELIAGTMSVSEIPEQWRAKMQEYLGVQPEHDGEGCLQDTHWAVGYFGYFPTYALGNMYAAQLFHALKKEHPNWEERVRNGDMHFIHDYLKENVHQYGRRFSPEALVKRATGEKLNAQYYIDYLSTKYGGV